MERGSDGWREEVMDGFAMQKVTSLNPGGAKHYLNLQNLKSDGQ